MKKLQPGFFQISKELCIGDHSITKHLGVESEDGRCPVNTNVLLPLLSQGGGNVRCACKVVS